MLFVTCTTVATTVLRVRGSVGVVGGVVKLLGETSHREMKGGEGTKKGSKAEEKEDGNTK